MRLPQLFVKVGKDRFVPVYTIPLNKPLYAWDDSKQRILPHTLTDDERILLGEGGAIHSPT